MIHGGPLLWTFRLDLILIAFYSFLFEILASIGLRFGVSKEVCNVILVFRAINGYDKCWRVVTNFTYVLTDWIDFEVSLIRLQKELKVSRPFRAAWIQPGGQCFRALIQYDGHPIMKELELLIRGSSDDSIGIDFLL